VPAGYAIGKKFLKQTHTRSRGSFTSIKIAHLAYGFLSLSLSLLLSHPSIDETSAESRLRAEIFARYSLIIGYLFINYLPISVSLY